MTALVTPFKNGKVDEAAFRGHVDWQIAQGTHGLVYQQVAETFAPFRGPGGHPSDAGLGELHSFAEKVQ
jgi:hypothetical protein